MKYAINTESEHLTDLGILLDQSCLQEKVLENDTQAGNREHHHWNIAEHI